MLTTADGNLKVIALRVVGAALSRSWKGKAGVLKTVEIGRKRPWPTIIEADIQSQTSMKVDTS